jgi:hypothetical protein
MAEIRGHLHYVMVSYVNQGLKTRAPSIPKNPSAGHSAQGELDSPRCGIFLMPAPPIIEEIPGADDPSGP